MTVSESACRLYSSVLPNHTCEFRLTQVPTGSKHIIVRQAANLPACKIINGGRSTIPVKRYLPAFSLSVEFRIMDDTASLKQTMLNLRKPLLVPAATSEDFQKNAVSWSQNWHGSGSCGVSVNATR